MKKILALLLCLTALTQAQEIQSPSTFLGFELGTQFSRHYEVTDYFEHLAERAPKRVKLTSYGTTYERRPLLLAYISSEKNMANLEAIRRAHLGQTSGQAGSEIAVVWLSYNVHGNESVSTEAAMKTAYELLTSKSDYLENTVVIMDPCINPDGRDRYSNWYNQYKNTPFQVDPNSKEHNEGWWSGRSNHYIFDLNRDWAWITQKESQQRLKVYNQWMPHIHVDFHEQGVDDPYYFAPAAEPLHEVITPFQRSFQRTIGKNHAKYFDREGWFYFTKERFDLFYPSYGDTYPMYNGGIGMTYEQGGSGRAGLAVINSNRDTLSLKDRINGHFTTGMSTVEVAAANAQKLNQEYAKYYKDKTYRYKSYVMSGKEDQVKALARFLDEHKIEYSFRAPGTVKGHNYQTGANGSKRFGANSLVVNTQQPKGKLIKVLFEPQPKLSDSLTYDITAWSLPYAYGLDAMATTAVIGSNANSSLLDFKTAHQEVPFLQKSSQSRLDAKAYAYLADWNSMEDARMLAHLLKKKIRVRKAYKDFEIEGNAYQKGSLIVTRSDNEHIDNLTAELEAAANTFQQNFTAVQSGYVDKGKDFGSSFVQMINPAKIAVLSGEGVGSYRFGEIWHYFEQQLHYPLTVLDTDYWKRVNLENYDILILPGGRYGSVLGQSERDELKEWIRKGGRLIAMENALNALAGDDKGFGLSYAEQNSSGEDKQPAPYDQTSRTRIMGAITGAIFKAKVDTSHPLAFGYDDEYFTLKLGASAFSYLDRGNVVYLQGNSQAVSGFAGNKAVENIQNTLVFGVQRMGRGSVVYMVDNPLFRGFWENGKLFMANALFMVD